MAKQPTVMRADLSRQLCKLEGWYDSRGGLAISSARKALMALSKNANFTMPNL